MNNNIETIYNNSSSPSEYISAYFKHLTQILSELDLSSIEIFLGCCYLLGKKERMYILLEMEEVLLLRHTLLMTLQLEHVQKSSLLK